MTITSLEFQRTFLNPSQNPHSNLHDVQKQTSRKASERKEVNLSRNNFFPFHSFCVQPQVSICRFAVLERQLLSNFISTHEANNKIKNIFQTVCCCNFLQDQTGQLFPKQYSLSLTLIVYISLVNNLDGIFQQTAWRYSSTIHLSEVCGFLTPAKSLLSSYVAGILGRRSFKADTGCCVGEQHLKKSFSPLIIPRGYQYRSSSAGVLACLRSAWFASTPVIHGLQWRGGLCLSTPVPDFQIVWNALLLRLLFIGLKIQGSAVPYAKSTKRNVGVGSNGEQPPESFFYKTYDDGLQERKKVLHKKPW
ncbi:hypothetical protein CEXT_587561 [Caerostris extrusa]|uniref:Uncharacterized protein n=1 Tax=Caerostris extrusa TaxID=172846 RepID=A0AAV4R175_CAEEX|nr:hypothetical protein CEXT_587561 [Caerostris extrusa]